jgi:hypothetical protein
MPSRVTDLKHKSAGQHPEGSIHRALAPGFSHHVFRLNPTHNKKKSEKTSPLPRLSFPVRDTREVEEEEESF